MFGTTYSATGSGEWKLHYARWTPHLSLFDSTPFLNSVMFVGDGNDTRFITVLKFDFSPLYILLDFLIAHPLFHIAFQLDKFHICLVKHDSLLTLLIHDSVYGPD